MLRLWGAISWLAFKLSPLSLVSFLSPALPSSVNGLVKPKFASTPFKTSLEIIIKQASRQVNDYSTKTIVSNEQKCLLVILVPLQTFRVRPFSTLESLQGLHTPKSKKNVPSPQVSRSQWNSMRRGRRGGGGGALTGTFNLVSGHALHGAFRFNVFISVR